MATLFEPLQGGPYPDIDDDNDFPGTIREVVEWAAERSVMRFDSVAQREALLPAPKDGQLCMTGVGSALRAWIYANGEWTNTGLGHSLPDPVVVYSSTTYSWTATSWTAVSDVTATLSSPRPAWVRAELRTWANVQSGSDIRVGIDASGATVSGPADPTWGAVGRLQNGSGGGTQRANIGASKLIRVEAGETTFTPQCYRGGSGFAVLEYPVLTIETQRWA